MGSVSHCQALHNPSSPGSVTKVKHSQLKMHFPNEQGETSFHTWTKRLEGFFFFLQNTVSFGSTFLRKQKPWHFPTAVARSQGSGALSTPSLEAPLV